MFSTAPPITLTEVGDRVRLELGCIAQGEGRSLQEAADDLVCAVLRLTAALRATGASVSRELAADVELFDYLSELGELAAAGIDIRTRLFC
jgi:hypothetical protein